MDTMPALWPSILQYLDSSEDGVVRIDRWRAWPAEVRERLEGAALFTPHLSSCAVCDQCWRACTVELEQSVTEERASYTALCDDEDEPVSQVTLHRERAMIWQPNWRMLTDRLRRLLAAYGMARECIPGRLWQLGRVRHPQGTGSVLCYLARGVWWTHDRRVFHYLTAPEREHDAIVLRFSDPIPPVPLPAPLPLRNYPLDSYLTCDAQGRFDLALDDLGVFTDAPATAVSASVPRPHYRLRVLMDACAIDVNDRRANLTHVEFQVMLALARCSLQSAEAWRSQLRLAEEAYRDRPQPEHFKQAINGRVKSIRDKLVAAGGLLPEDRAALIEADASGHGYRINRRLAMVEIV